MRGPLDSNDWLEAALDRHEAALVGYALRLTGNLDSAREIVQEAFMRLCDERPRSGHGPQPRGENHVAAWLYTVCRNRAVDVRRKERRMMPLAESVADARECPMPGPAAIVETRETGSRLLELLTVLPANQQEVIRLKFGSGLSYKEISEVTKLSVSNVGFLIHTGLKTLRERMSESETNDQRRDRQGAVHSRAGKRRIP